MSNTKMTDKQKVTTMADSDYVFGNFGGKVGQMSIPDFRSHIGSTSSVDSPDLSALQRRISSVEDKNTEQDTRINALLQEIPWEGYHMNAFTDTGEYHIHGERTDANDGLPILNSGTIDARLTVLDSSLTNGTGEKTDIVVTQILRLSNRMGGDGHVYVRTAQAENKSQLATQSSTAWGTWEKLMGMFEKNAVKNIADLDTYTTNGMYSGLFHFENNVTSAISGGVEMFTGSTFLMITVNGYAVAKAGLTPQLTQMLYLLPSKKGSEGVSASMYVRTAWWNVNADPKKWEFSNWDRLVTSSELVEEVGYLGQEDSRLNGLIAENTAKISSVESTAIIARDTASNARTAATAAQETANSALGTATAASTAAQDAITAARNAQSDATAAQEKNTAQDARLDAIENSVSHLSAAGRYWDEANGTPTAKGYYGSLDALRSLPKKLGLGRYLVNDNRDKRKLHPKYSWLYEDETPAKLDGTDGQCMWCWNRFCANIWKEGDNLFKVVSFDRPVGNGISIWIPAGGISWLGAGVIDRGEAPYTDKTKWKLCSIISDPTLDPQLYGPDFNAERYRGGAGNAVDVSACPNRPAEGAPQITMIGMPATMMSAKEFGDAARLRGDGWEANWFVARFVVEFLFEVIMGTENSQAAFNANKDANGLYQGGFGDGITSMQELIKYNNNYPVIPTSVGLEAGDGVCLVDYNLPNASGGTHHTFKVPVFFGLVGAGYGNLWQLVRGLILDPRKEKQEVYVAPSMYADYYPNTVEDKIMVAECPKKSGYYITRKSYRGLCCMPTELNGSQVIRYSDCYYTRDGISEDLRVRIAGGFSGNHTEAGASYTNMFYDYEEKISNASSPLCYFTEDPEIPDSQSIANNS